MTIALPFHRKQICHFPGQNIITKNETSLKDLLRFGSECSTKLERYVFVFISVNCQLLMNLIDCNDFVTLITDSIRVVFTCLELNSYNLYEFPRDRYRANNCHLEDKVPGICYRLLALYQNNWSSSWDYGSYRIGDQRRLRRACASAQSCQSLRCSPTWSMEIDEGSDQNQTSSPTRWLRMRVWRTIRKTKIAIVSWAGSYSNSRETMAVMIL